MEIKENRTLAFLEIGEGLIKEPVYKSELKIMNITIRLEKRFNWLQKKMYKFLLGIDIEDIK